MLPLIACGATEKIGRTRCEENRRALPTLAGLLAKVKHAWSKQADSDQPIAALVFCYEKVCEVLFSKSGQTNTRGQGEKTLELGLTQPRVIEIILPAKPRAACLRRRETRVGLCEKEEDRG
jgi:hypothetical protein